MTPAEYAALQERAHKRLVDALETRSPDSVNAADFAAAALLIVHELSEVADELKATRGGTTRRHDPDGRCANAHTYRYKDGERCGVCDQKVGP